VRGRRCRVQTVHHVPVGASDEMLIGVDANLDRGVPELAQDVRQVFALREEEAGVSVMQVVKADTANSDASDALEQLAKPKGATL